MTANYSDLREWKDRTHPGGTDWRKAHADLLDAVKRFLGIGISPDAPVVIMPILKPSLSSRVTLETAIECARFLHETSDGGREHPREEKPVLTGLFRDNPATPEGKYLVKRRDGSVVEWPSFVLGARDPMAEVALRAYADDAEWRDHDAGWVAAIRRLADEFRAYREMHGEGDPGMGRHRKDDPATIAEMLKGRSA